MALALLSSNPLLDSISSFSDFDDMTSLLQNFQTNLLSDSQSLLCHSFLSNTLHNHTSIGAGLVNQAFRELDGEALDTPKVDVKESPDAFEFIASVPGLDKEDMQVQVRGKDVLTITGKRTREERDADDSNRVVREFRSFKRSFRLPRGVSTKKIKAAARNGVLTVTVPKRTTPQKARGSGPANPKVTAEGKDEPAGVAKRGGLNGEQPASKRRKAVRFAPGI
ncbi:hypothetical protein CLOM_g16316 [Closterium sp. NIES-68]|nr:hypothetical protein CLOM_g16316 [Closterium sp. NIES-68]GJP65809.1 hypothetical protein CLOP_g22725 [Closterium sp. NIES-67]